MQRAKSIRSEVNSIRRDGSASPVELFTDVAYIGDVEPQRILMVSSGLHGVEGFFGSAMQLLLFELIDKHHVRFDKTGIVLIHALNPFGFQHCRRFDENNVDLNRNFLLPDEEYAGATETYRNLDAMLNPKQWPKREIPFQLQAYWKVLQHGLPAMKQAIAAGQYEYPNGLFFGGCEPSATMKMVEAELFNWTRNAAEVLHLDLHTGLGKSGECKLLRDTELLGNEYQKWRSLFGNQLPEVGSKPVHYRSIGTIGHWLEHHFPAGQFTSFCAEFGTFGPIKVLDALRAENAAWHHRVSEEPNSSLKEIFCPQNIAGAHQWEAAVLSSARSLFEQSLSWIK